MLWHYFIDGQQTTPAQVDTLGEYIQWLRARDGLTQAELAGLAGVSARFLSDMENDKPSIRLDLVLSVLETLGVEGILSNQPVKDVSMDVPARQVVRRRVRGRNGPTQYGA